MVRKFALGFVLLVGCGYKQAAKEVPTQPQSLATATIVGWTPRENDTPSAVYIQLHPEYQGPGMRKLMWVQFGKKVVLPTWFTIGEGAQALRGDELEAAWRRGATGVYKMDYSAPVVREVVFKGYKVEVN